MNKGELNLLMCKAYHLFGGSVLKTCSGIIC